VSITVHKDVMVAMRDGVELADESASEVTVAVNRVLHGPDYPSRLTLPVIRR